MNANPCIHLILNSVKLKSNEIWLSLKEFSAMKVKGWKFRRNNSDLKKEGINKGSDIKYDYLIMC